MLDGQPVHHRAGRHAPLLDSLVDRLDELRLQATAVRPGSADQLGQAVDPIGRGVSRDVVDVADPVLGALLVTSRGSPVDRPRTPASAPPSRRRRCRGGRVRRGRACPAPSRRRRSSTGPAARCGRRGCRWVSSAGVDWRSASSGRTLARSGCAPECLGGGAADERVGVASGGCQREPVDRPGQLRPLDEDLEAVDPQLAIGVAGGRPAGCRRRGPPAVAGPRGRARDGGPARRAS